jgi:hypothetical protein
MPKDHTADFSFVVTRGPVVASGTCGECGRCWWELPMPLVFGRCRREHDYAKGYYFRKDYR